MKKNLLLIISSCFLFIGCKKEIDEQKVQSDIEIPKPICGTDHSGQSIPAEFLEQLVLQRTAGQLQKIVMYLDFDGEIVFPGFASLPGLTRSTLTNSPRMCPPPVLSTTQIQEIIRLIEDDFAPFNIEVTTDRAKHDAFPPNARMSCIFTTTSSVMGFPSFVGGVAPFSFGLITNQPCFVFCSLYGTNVADMASVASQELGHLFGMEHQHVFNESCFPISEYHPGFGTGPLGFAPIMGEADQRMTTWWGQPCQPQNDFSFISNVVDLKPDDFPDSPGNWTEQVGGFTGTLGHPGDVDFIFIRPLTPTAIQITADNIDLQVSYCAPGGAVIATYNDPDDTHVTIPRLAGLGFLKIEAASNANLQSQFMTGNYVVTYLDK